MPARRGPLSIMSAVHGVDRARVAVVQQQPSARRRHVAVADEVEDVRPQLRVGGAHLGAPRLMEELDVDHPGHSPERLRELAISSSASTTLSSGLAADDHEDPQRPANRQDLARAGERAGHAHQRADRVDPEPLRRVEQQLPRQLAGASARARRASRAPGRTRCGRRQRRPTSPASSRAWRWLPMRASPSGSSGLSRNARMASNSSLPSALGPRSGGASRGSSQLAAGVVSQASESSLSNSRTVWRSPSSWMRIRIVGSTERSDPCHARAEYTREPLRPGNHGDRSGGEAGVDAQPVRVEFVELL